MLLSERRERSRITVCILGTEVKGQDMKDGSSEVNGAHSVSLCRAREWLRGTALCMTIRSVFKIFQKQIIVPLIQINLQILQRVFYKTLGIRNSTLFISK